MSLEYRIERSGGTITVAPEGDISLETVDALREVLRSVIDSPNVSRIDVEMSAVDFLDSSGLGVLVASQRAAAKRDISLMLLDPAPVVRMVLQVTNLETTMVRTSSVG